MGAENKTIEDLSLQLEALTLEHSECEKNQAALKKKFEDACIELATVARQLKDVRARYDKVVEENGRLRSELRQFGEKEK